MTWATITGAGTTTATKFFGDVMNKINNMLGGTDISDTVSIHANVTWTFKGSALKVRNPGDTFSYSFTGDAITANRQITLPLLTGTDVMVTADYIQTLTNKKLSDSTTSFIDEGDATKIGKFQLSGVTTGNTRTLTWPDFDGTIATLAGTETLTGKTLNLTSNTLSGTIAQFNTALSDGDFATLAGSETLTNKILSDSTSTFGNVSDTTKAVKFSLGGATTAKTLTLISSHTDNRSITFPDASITLGPTVLGLQDMWIPAGAMFPRTTTGCAALAQRESSTNKVNMKVLDFDQTTQEYAQFVWQPARNWDNGTVKVTPYWTADGGSASETVIWSIRAGAFSNDDAIDTALGTAQTSTDALIATGDLHIGPQTSAITIAGTPADSDAVVFEISRDTSDTLAADARLIGITVEYTIDAATAA